MLKYLHDFRRIFTFTEDIIYLLGRSLQRHAMRNGILITMAYGSTLLGIKLSGSDRLTQQQIYSLIIAAFASYPTGTILVRISNFLTEIYTGRASAGHMMLTSHYKKISIKHHLRLLWRQVFIHEARLVADVDHTINSRSRLKLLQSSLQGAMQDLPAEVKRSLNLNADSDIRRMVDIALSSLSHDSAVEPTEELFLLTASYALKTPLPQSLQQREVGFDISLLEDWYQKGLFSYEDFPGKSFQQDPLIRECKNAVGSDLWNRLWSFISSEASPSFWYAYTVRKMAVLTGRALWEINRQLHSDEKSGYFNSQHLLWPSKDLDQDILIQFPKRGDHLLRRLRELRLRNTQQLFSRNQDVAMRHVLRMFLSDYRRVFRLRLKYDQEFASREASLHAESELQWMRDLAGVHLVSAETFSRTRKRAIDQTAAFDRRLPALEKFYAIDAELLRILRWAYFVNHRSFRSIANLNTESSSNQIKHIKQVCESLDYFEVNKPIFTNRLIRLRTYHALVKIQVETYWQLVSQLGEYTTNAKHWSMQPNSTICP